MNEATNMKKATSNRLVPDNKSHTLMPPQSLENKKTNTSHFRYF